MNATNKLDCTALMIASEKGNIDAMKVLLSAGAETAMENSLGNTWIHCAIYGNCSKEVLQTVINSGAAVNATNKENCTSLILAGWKGNADAINKLLSAGADSAIADANGNTWLHYALYGNCSEEVIQVIIDHGADVNATNKQNCTALMLASINGNVNVMNVLLKAGANKAIEDTNCDTWLQYALYGNCSEEVLQVIIDHGADVNATNKQKRTALMLASMNGNMDVINVLLKVKAKMEIEDADGYTWIHYAVVKSCNKEVLQAIIDHGANVNATSKQKRTALMMVSRNGNVDAMCVLLKSGAEMEIEDADGYTWLHYAVIGGCPKDVLQVIIDHGANVNATNKKNCTALIFASEKQNIEAMNVLLCAGANRDIKDAAGNTWLHYAIQDSCSKETLQTMIDLGADVNATNNENVTALMMFSKMGNVEAMNVLIEAGADRSTKDVNGFTWLHYAACGISNKEKFQAVINLGAELNVTNKCHRTPLMMACHKGNIEAINVLFNSGADGTIEDHNGETWLHHAVKGDCSKEVLQAIIDLGAEVNAMSKQSVTALMIVSDKGNIDAMNILLTAGAHMNIEDADGCTWLHYAIVGDCSKEVLQTIVKLGAEVNARVYKWKCTALMLASYRGNVDAVNILLSAGANHANKDVYGETWLHYAVQGSGSKEVLEAAIDLGADVNATNEMDCTALMLATGKGNLDAINLLLSAGATKPIKDVCGNTWLHYAVFEPFSKEVLQTVIDLGADVNATNTSNTTALMLASKKGNIDAINVLLDAGANKAIKDANGSTWIHYAVDGNCSKEVLQVIVDNGAEVNATNKQNCSTLMMASQKGNVDAMRLLLNSGANYDIEDNYGNTWLHYAVDGGCCKILQTAIDLGANVNAANTQHHKTALILASEKGNLDAINVLLDAGAKQSIKDVNDNTWLHYAVAGGCSKEVLQAIIDLGADVNAVNTRKETALMLASKKGNIDGINALLDAGANKTIDDANGSTLLHYALGCSKEVLQTVIKLGAEVNATDKQKRTALMLASGKGNVGAIGVLMEAGADPGIVDVYGNTWLHCVVNKAFSREMLQTIIDFGAKLDATNKQNETALLIACDAGQRESAGVLLRAGADTSIADVSGNTCLHKIIHKGCDQETLQVLIDHGVPVNAMNRNYQTAYMLACDQGNVDAMCALVIAGADPSFRFYAYTARHLSK